MSDVVDQIKSAMHKQGLSESALAQKAGLGQKRVNRLLRGDTKRLDLDVIASLQKALGLIPDVAADQPLAYGVTEVHRSLSPKQEKALRIIEEFGDDALDFIVSLEEVPELRQVLRDLKGKNDDEVLDYRKGGRDALRGKKE